MNKEQKHALTAALLAKAGDRVEFWGEYCSNLPEGHPLLEVAPQEAARQLAVWLQYLPGSHWDVRLPSVDTLGAK